MRTRRPLRGLARGAACCAAAAALTAWTLTGAAGVAVLPERQAQIFAKSCAHCHAVAGRGVPVVGDPIWAERAAKGLEALVANTIQGIGNMPPLGTCGFCTEEDFRILVRFLAESGSPR